MRKKPVGVTHIEGVAGTHAILKTGEKFKTFCGIPLEVVDEEAVKQFLNTRIHMREASCNNCHQAEKREIEKEIRALLKN